jgi:hypothetical protein
MDFFKTQNQGGVMNTKILILAIALHCVAQHSFGAVCDQAQTLQTYSASQVHEQYWEGRVADELQIISDTVLISLQQRTITKSTYNTMILEQWQAHCTWQNNELMYSAFRGGNYEDSTAQMFTRVFNLVQLSGYEEGREWFFALEDSTDWQQKTQGTIVVANESNTAFVRYQAWVVQYDTLYSYNTNGDVTSISIATRPAIMASSDSLAIQNFLTTQAAEFAAAQVNDHHYSYEQLVLRIVYTEKEDPVFTWGQFNNSKQRDTSFDDSKRKENQRGFGLETPVDVKGRPVSSSLNSLPSTTRFW